MLGRSGFNFIRDLKIVDEELVMLQGDLKRILLLLFYSDLSQRYLCKSWKNNVMLKNLSCVKKPLISNLSYTSYNDKLSQDSSKILDGQPAFAPTILSDLERHCESFLPSTGVQFWTFPLFQTEFCVQSACRVRLMLAFVVSNWLRYLVSQKKVLLTLAIKTKESEHEMNRQDCHSFPTQYSISVNTKVFSHKKEPGQDILHCNSTFSKCWTESPEKPMWP